MLPKIHLVALGTSLIFLGTTLVSIRRGRLREQYALLWLLTSLALTVFSLTPKLIANVAAYMGIVYPPAALFFVAVVGLLAGTLHFSLAMSKLADQQLRLAQQMAILEQELAQVQHPGRTGS